MKLFFRCLLLFFFTNSIFSQGNFNEIKSIEFNFTHSRRIPYHKISIKILKRINDVSLTMISTPMNDDEKWKYSKKEKTLKISNKQFSDLFRQSSKLKEIDFNIANVFGFDGTTCSIKLGYFNSLTYTFWTPTSSTKKRGLENFLQLCEKILELGNLNPKEIL